MFLYNVCHYLCIMLGFWTVLAGGFGRIRTIEPQNSLSSGSDVNYFTYTAKNGRARKISFGRSEILRKNKRSVSPKSTFDVEMWQKGYNKFDNVRNTAPNGRTSLKKMIEEFPCPERLCEDDNRENEVVTFSTVNENISTSSDNSSTTTTYGFLFSASLPEIIAICISSGTASLITVAGNVLVIASFAINKSLRIVNNYLILSLAAADLLIGTISMNLFTISIVHGEWRLGAAVCDFWLTLDYVASNASVMNLFIICLDRYFSVTKPVKYRNARTKKRFLMAIAGAWIISFVLWAPWIAGWQYIVGSRSVPENQCYIQFLKENKAVTVITAIGAFYLPAGAMCVLYWQVYQGIKNSRKKILGMNKTPNDDSTKSVSDDEHGDHITKSTRKNNFERWRILNCCANEKKKRTKKGIKEKRHIFTLATKCLGGILCCFKGNKKEAISPSVRERKNVDASNQAFIKGDCADKSPEREYEYRSKPTQSFLEINRKNDNFVSREIHPQETPKQEPFHYSKESIPFIEGDESPPAYNKLHASDDEQAVSVTIDSDFQAKSSEISLKTSSRKLPGNPVDKKMKEYALPTRSVRRLPNIPRESRSTANEDVHGKRDTLPQQVWQDINSPNMRHACSEPYLTADNSGIPRADSPTLPPLINRAPVEHSTCTMNSNNQQPAVKVPTEIVTSDQAHIVDEAVLAYQEEDTLLQTTITTVDSSDPPMSAMASANATPNLCRTKAGKEIAFTAHSPKQSSNLANPPIAKVGDRLKTQAVKKKLQSLKKETKAARLLASILAAFIILWTPYNVLVLVEAFCFGEETCVPDILWNIGYWLCYLNSTLNPVCYAMCNTSFRRTFKVILSMKWLDKRQRRMMNRPNMKF